MEQGEQYRVVLVTAPDIDTGRRLAKVTLEANLIACANIIPQVESHFTWEGKVEMESEALIVFKTTDDRLNELEGMIKQHHPYDTPEILALPIHSGVKDYLNWVADCTRK